jgi:PAS domain S-box-containing protein
MQWRVNPDPIISSGKRQIVLLVAFGLAVAMSFLALSAWQLWKSRQDEVSLGIRNGQNLTALLSEHLSRIVGSVDLLLTDMSEDNRLAFTKPGWDAREAHEYLKGHTGASLMIRSFFIIDKDGAVLADSRTYPPSSANASDREYFRSLMNPANPPLYVGSPIESRYNGSWFIPVARRLTDANGKFNGIVGAGIEPNYLRRLFVGLQVGPGGSIAVLHQDGRLVARAPEVAGSIGRPLDNNVLFQKYLPQAPDGFFNASSVIDGVPRLFSYRVAPRTPFIVVVGVAQDYVLAGWYTSLKTYGLAVIACCVPLFVLTTLLVRNQVRRNELAAKAMKGFRRFQSVFDGSADGLVAMDTGGRILTMNPAAIRMFGGGPDQLGERSIGHLIPGLVLPGSGASKWSAPKITDEIAAENHAELEGRTLDGQSFPLDLMLSGFVEDGERIIIGSIRDLTERNKAAEALREAEARFQFLAENINIVPYAFTLQEAGRLDYVGPQAERLFGYPIRDWLAPSFWRDHVHPDDVEAAVAQENRLSSTGDSYELEYRMIAADGRVVWIRDLVRIVATDAVSKTGFGVFIDISDAKERDQRLAQVQRMEAVGQLTGGLAHDLNNALTVIIGNLEMTIDGVQGNQRLVTAAELALEEARRSADIVRRLLAFARQQPLQPQEAELNRLIQSMTELLRRSLGKEFAIETVLELDLWPAIVDPFQLEDVLLSLVINARDAMPRGGRIVIETANVPKGTRIMSDGAEADAAEFAMIAVSDTGIGMRPEILARIFEPFFTTKEIGKGSGLGLSAVYGFAKQSGGHVEIQSESDRGTIVRLYLPRTTTTAVAPAKAAGSRPRGTERILVVDDDPLVREFVVTQLTELGYGVVQAANGPAALTTLSSNLGIKLLFSDVAMPGMNGSELAELALQQRPELKILLTSGHAESVDTDAIAALKLTMLSKPYSWDQLAVAVRDTLDRADRRDAAVAYRS